MDDLYRDYILDHYKNPRNFGELEPHDLEAFEHNPLCGDELGVHIRVQDDRIAELRFHGHGCAISQAAASISSEELKGMPLAEAGQLGADWLLELLGREGVCIRAGHHCAQPLMRCLGVSATARASVGVYNGPGDVQALLAALHGAREVFALDGVAQARVA